MGLTDIVLDNSRAASHHDYRTSGTVDVPRTIPLRSISRAMWTCDDTKKAILFSLVPGGVALAALNALANDKNTLEFWKNCKKPNWAPDLRLHGALELLTLAPLGYATYLVYKNGGIEFTDTRAALGLYGANVALQLASIPLFKKKDLKMFSWNCALKAATAAACSFAYYKIDKTAGMLMLPYTLWSSFCAFLTCAVSEQNKPKRVTGSGRIGSNDSGNIHSNPNI